MSNKDKSINPTDLPDDNVFKQTDVNQYPQPADQGKPMRGEEHLDPSLKGKQADRTSETEGLNEANSDAQAGAYEGFEDQGDK